MKSLKDILDYLKRHKNNPDLHSAHIQLKSGILFVDYSYGAYDVYYLSPDTRDRKYFLCKTVEEVLKHFSGGRHDLL